MRRHFDPASVVVIAITFVLFVIAALLKGLVHDLLLEAGVFLVSVKLIMMAYKSSVTSAELIGRLEHLRSSLERIERLVDVGRRPDAPSA
jgi:hypothetical protein